METTESAGTKGTTDPTVASMLSEVGGYVGAAFVVASAAALVVPTWDHWPTPARVAVLAVPGLLLVMGAFAVATAAMTGPRRRLVRVLTLSGVALVAAAAAVAAHSGRVVAPALLAGWALGYWFVRGPLLHLALGAVLPWALGSAVDPSSAIEWRLYGGLLVLAGAIWATASAYEILAERDLGLAVAGVLAFAGSETFVVNHPAAVGYLLLAALAATALAGYLRTRLLAALVVGAAALAVVVPQAVTDYTSGSLGAAGVLLLAGLSIVGASALSLRWRVGR